MAEGTYEFECMRAELLGLEKPDKDKFEADRAEILRAQQEELAAAEAKELENDEESMNRSGGKLDELNSILSVTQKKLNRFKQTACGSLSNIFKTQSMEESECALKEDKGETSAEKPDINDALSNLEQMENVERQSDIQVAKHASLDIQKKMTSHLDKLDSLINKADHAELSMAAQNKQIKKFVKK